jgi:hypothetical protein
LIAQPDGIENEEEQRHKGHEVENNNEAVRRKEAEEDTVPVQAENIGDKKTDGTDKALGANEPDNVRNPEGRQISHESEKLDGQQPKAPVETLELSDEDSESRDTTEIKRDEAGTGDEIKTISESTEADEAKRARNGPAASSVPVEEMARANQEMECTKEKEDATSEYEEADETEPLPRSKKTLPKPRSIQSNSDVEEFDTISITSDDSCLFDNDWDNAVDPHTSPAAHEWARQKREQGQSNQSLDQLMSMVGLEEIKTHFLNVKAEIEAARRRDEEYWQARGKKIFKDDVDKGPNTRNLNLNLVLMGNMGTGMV